MPDERPDRTEILLDPTEAARAKTERSWLFFLMIMRAADQRLGSVPRVLVFGHLSTLSYALMIAYVALVEHHRITPGAEVAKIVILYSANLYLAATARTADSVRRRLVASIRVAREMLARRDEAVASLRDRHAVHPGAAGKRPRPGHHQAIRRAARRPHLGRQPREGSTFHVRLPLTPRA